MTDVYHRFREVLRMPDKEVRHTPDVLRVVSLCKDTRFRPISWLLLVTGLVQKEPNRRWGVTGLQHGEAGATIKRPDADGGDRAHPGDIDQACAATKRTISDGGDRGHPRDIDEVRAAIKRKDANGGDRAHPGDIDEAGAPIKRRIADGGDRAHP